MNTETTLPDLVLYTRANQTWEFSGIDHIDQCRDRRHFLEYPYDITYKYNSRGFRDEEWPEYSNDLRNSIWCLGDSFTVGIGQPYSHIWPQVLSKTLNRRTINISMDGASNDWIFRRACQIQQEIAPEVMIVLWSYTGRREKQDVDLSDEQRRGQSTETTFDQDLQHWIGLVSALCKHTRKIIQGVIPGFHNVPDPYRIWNQIRGDNWPLCPTDLDSYNNLEPKIKYELQSTHHCDAILKSIFTLKELGLSSLQSPPFARGQIIHVETILDWARDHHHFDILTAQWLVDHISIELQR